MMDFSRDKSYQSKVLFLKEEFRDINKDNKYFLYQR